MFFLWLQAFQELQAKMIDSKQKIKMADIQIDHLNATKAHAKLTQSEISKLKPDNKLYEGVGRMFVYAEMDTIKKHVEER